MLITVKILQGRECGVEVTAATSISKVKEMVAEQLHMPLCNHRLIHRGKPLTDSSCLGDYSVQDGAKLHLVVKKPDDNENTDTTVLWDEIHEFLRKYFSPEESEKILKEFEKDFSNSVSSLSLDDLERIAVFYQEKQTGKIPTLSF